jgi:hypothetical protein
VLGFELEHALNIANAEAAMAAKTPWARRSTATHSDLPLH